MADDTTRKSGEQNELEGKARELGGRVQRAWGDLTGDTEHQVEGAKKELKGKAQGKVGEAQETLEDIERMP
ncbi:MAG TPA: CsbD family protein [Gemmatimonadaceae bacterium]|nr:CsbD family protein [Gemmatimonadaceae bacterium]